jgi:hypothetical protein
MRKLSVSVFAVISLLAMSSLALAQSVAGEWDAQMETPGQPSLAKVIFKQEGEKLTGTVKRASGDSPLEGTCKGKEVKFNYVINYNGNEVAIGISGTLEGDTIKGMADIAGGSFQGGWMAKRISGTGAATPTQNAPASAAGSDAWEVTINSPQGSTTSMFVFTKDGENLKGALKSPRGETPAQGTLKGSDITIKFTVKFQDNDLPITLTGKVEGEAAKGEADFGGFAQGDWSGKRAAAPAATGAAPAAPSGVNVSGQWDATVETGQGSGNPSFTFKQEGEKLTGRYKGLLGESELTGTVKGNQIDFAFKVSGQLDGTITYSGTTDGKTMKGKVSLAGLGEGTFTGTKK